MPNGVRELSSPKGEGGWDRLSAGLATIARQSLFNSTISDPRAGRRHTRSRAVAGLHTRLLAHVIASGAPSNEFVHGKR